MDLNKQHIDKVFINGNWVDAAVKVTSHELIGQFFPKVQNSISQFFPQVQNSSGTHAEPATIAPTYANRLSQPKTSNTPSYVIHYNDLAGIGRKLCFKCEDLTAPPDDHLCPLCRYGYIK